MSLLTRVWIWLILETFQKKIKSLLGLQRHGMLDAGVGVFSISILHHVLVFLPMLSFYCLFNGIHLQNPSKSSNLQFQNHLQKNQTNKKHSSPPHLFRCLTATTSQFLPLPTPPPPHFTPTTATRTTKPSVQSFAKCCPIYSDSERSCKVPWRRVAGMTNPGSTPDTTVTRLDLQY